MNEKFNILEWCMDNVDKAHLNSTKQVVGNCPWCSKSGHFYVDSESGHYICFACEEKGKGLVGLLAHVEGITESEARKFMLRNAVQSRRKHTPKSLRFKIETMVQDSYDPPDVDYPLPDEFISVWKNGKWRFPKYLKNRKIRGETAKKWGLGCAMGGRYAGRVIIPVRCPNGHSFTARDVTGKQEPRYLNPAGADHSRLLLGWEFCKYGADLVLVEGPFDAIKMWQHGFSTMALMGKVLHSEQLSMLLNMPSDITINVMLDPEEIEAPYKVAEQLLCRFKNVYIAKLPLGIDPGSSSKKEATLAIDKSVLFTGNRNNKLADLIGKSKKRMENFYS